MTSEAAEEFGHQAELTLGENVARFRALLGLSMRDLRERSGVSISIISRVEHGLGTSVSVAAKLAGGLGVSLPGLLEPHADFAGVAVVLDDDVTRISTAVLASDFIPRQREPAERTA